MIASNLAPSSKTNGPAPTSSGVLSLATACGCLSLAACGWIANALSPGCTTLDALSFVGGFYLVLGVGGLASRPSAARIDAADRATYAELRKTIPARRGTSCRMSEIR